MLTIERLGRWLVVTAIVALALGQQAPAGAAPAERAPLPEPSGGDILPIPALPPGCVATTRAFTQSAAQLIPDVSTITSTLPVSGMGPYIWDVTAQTLISHTFSSDLNVYLIAPNQFGYRNTLTTRNGYDFDGHDVDAPFLNTVWSDQAPLGVTELNFADNVTQPFVIPEGAMGAYAGHHNPNGNWQLVVQDAAALDTGRLNGWTLSITTLPFYPRGNSQFPTDSTVHPIPNPGTLTTTLSINNAGPVLEDVTLLTYITHSNSGDLNIVLTAPSGLTTTLVNGRANGFADQYNGTLWTDAPVGGGPVTDATYVNGVPLDQVQPEGAMGHFKGSNPNGVWTLAITDMRGGADSGSLDSWQLGVYTRQCNALYLPAVER